MKCLVTTPYDVDSQSGNSVSAHRIAELLRLEDLEAVVVSSSDLTSMEGEILIALHARKSAAAIEYFKVHNPRGKVVLFFTGTDLYVDLPAGCLKSERSIVLADALVVSQVASLQSVPDAVRYKTKVIHKSLLLPSLPTRNNKGALVEKSNLVSILGHLRAVKRPLDLVKAIALKPNLNIEVKLIGSSYDKNLSESARTMAKVDKRFRWLGELSREEALRVVMNSMLTVNSSELEGGANSVGESIMLGVPVLASRIEGNLGMLGVDYQGYFPCGDIDALAFLLEEAISDDNFYEVLKKQTIERQSMFQPQQERKDWLELLRSI